jgi:hypothetical protein
VHFRQLYLSQLADRLAAMVVAMADSVRSTDAALALALGEAGALALACLSAKACGEGERVALVAARVATERLNPLVLRARETEGHSVRVLAELEELVGSVERALMRTERASTPPRGFQPINVRPWNLVADRGDSGQPS